MQIHVCKKKKWPPIDITRKYEKLCIVAFNRKFDYDDVIKNERNVICLVGNCLSYNISKFGRNWSPVSEITSIERRTLWRHQWKLNYFELRCKYDDFLSLCRRHGGMESYLQLMLFPTMKNWGSCTIHRNWCRSSIGWGVICDLELGNFF